MRRHRVAWELHPVLTDILNTLGDSTPLGRAFNDRAVEASTLKVLGDPVEPALALAAYSHLLERADGDGLPLTAAGYLKPADVRALAAVMPTMSDWTFSMTREIDVYPVLCFREYVKSIGLLRKYKGFLRLTRLGRVALHDPAALWTRIADTLAPDEQSFHADATVIVLVHMATTEGRINTAVVAQTLTALGWSHRDGSPVREGEAHDVWNELWDVLGNIGEVEGSGHWDRMLSPAARVMVHEALFTEVPAHSSIRHA
ncbi:MAG: hypothetical protein QM630_03305 [Microbacterium sp.]